MNILRMKKNVVLVVLFVTSGLMTQSVMASPKHKGIDKKQKHQKHRIIHGVKSGKLTYKEIGRLAKQQRNIRLKEKHFKADGQFTRKERAIIHADLARASRRIHRAKHN